MTTVIVLRLPKIQCIWRQILVIFPTFSQRGRGGGVTAQHPDSPSFGAGYTSQGFSVIWKPAPPPNLTQFMGALLVRKVMYPLHLGESFTGCNSKTFMLLILYTTLCHLLTVTNVLISLVRDSLHLFHYGASAELLNIQVLRIVDPKFPPTVQSHRDTICLNFLLANMC